MVPHLEIVVEQRGIHAPKEFHERVDRTVETQERKQSDIKTFVLLHDRRTEAIEKAAPIFAFAVRGDLVFRNDKEGGDSDDGDDDTKDEEEEEPRLSGTIGKSGGVFVSPLRGRNSKKTADTEHRGDRKKRKDRKNRFDFRTVVLVGDFRDVGVEASVIASGTEECHHTVDHDVHNSGEEERIGDAN